jgi:hypothetical protein
MGSKSNIERIKLLAEEISKKENDESDFKKETVCCLSKIKDLLCKPRSDKKVIVEELDKLIGKLS